MEFLKSFKPKGKFITVKVPLDYYPKSEAIKEKIEVWNTRLQEKIRENFSGKWEVLNVGKDVDDIKSGDIISIAGNGLAQFVELEGNTSPGKAYKGGVEVDCPYTVIVLRECDIIGTHE